MLTYVGADDGHTVSYLVPRGIVDWNELASKVNVFKSFKSTSPALRIKM